MPSKSALYVVATPIGNLNDITLRALNVLQSVDIIAAEHVQNSKRLLYHHAINTRLLTLHQHNEAEMLHKISGLLTTGKSVAIITDAGTPAISDPGAILVKHVRESGFPVIPIPGANAAICALSASGIANPHFLFYGFLPTKSGQRQRELNLLAALPYTLVFYEAPHRILDSLHDMIQVFNRDRQVTIARELTKVFETIYQSTLGEALQWIEADSDQQKGEFVLLVSGATPPDNSELSVQALKTLQLLLAELPLNQAVKLTAKLSGENKKALYQRALHLKS